MKSWIPKVVVGLLVVAIFLVVQSGEMLKKGVEIPKEIQEKVAEITEEPTEYLVSNRMDREFFDDAFTQAGRFSDTPKLPKGNIMIVPHHLFASSYIAEMFASQQSTQIDRVIIIAPDHFGQLKGSFGTSVLPWKTPYGFLYADKQGIAQLDGVVGKDDRAFDFEHSVSALIPFVKQSFPRAYVMPILVSENAREVEIAQLIMDLPITDNTLVVGSFDFSHYLPQNVATYHDILAQETLRYEDVRRVERLDIDSKKGLEIVIKIVKEREAKEKKNLVWHQARNTSANLISGNLDTIENTSYFTGVYAPGEEKRPEKKATLTIFGDIMLDRRVRKTLDEKGSAYPLLKMERFMMGSDRVVANLEGPFTDNKSVAQPNVLTFTFDPSHAPTLKKFGITSVSLANNHTLNFGGKGLQNTREVLKKTGIAYFGDPSNKTELSFVEEVGGLKVAHVGYHQFSFGFENVTAEIKRLRPLVDYILVYPHWGEEYETTKPTSRSKQEAHAFIDAGADIILGGHPHVVQPLELYKNKMIVYSMGNFIFDQQFSVDVKTGLSVGLVLSERAVELHLFPIEHNDMQISLSGAQKRDTLLTSVAKYSVVSEEMKQQIRDGVVKIIK